MITRMRNKILVVAWLVSCGTAANASTLHVGPGQAYPTIAAGVAAAQDGDTLAVRSGTYINDFATIGVRLTLRATGGRVTMRATEDIPNHEGILVVQADTTIDSFTFRNARISAEYGANGAGVRYISGKLVVKNCWFTHNQDGLFANPSAGGTITVLNSQFDHNGHRTGPQAGHTHNLYVGTIDRLDVENSYFTQAIEGHEIKSRALVTVIKNSRIVDGPGSTASYSVDLPNGGKVELTDLRIEQGPDSSNGVIIAFGEEGDLLAGSRLVVGRSLIENDLETQPLGVWNATNTPVTLAHLRVFGLTESDLVSGLATERRIKWLTSEPKISARHPF